MSELRPFYFIVVVWGKQFRDYLTDYCIPSLLAPNNIPKLLNNSQNKFLLCTTQEDWKILVEHPTIHQLKQYMEPVLIEIPLPKPGVSSCQHMGIGHKLATDLCFNHKAYGIALTPDLLISDGTLTAVQKYALMGKKLILCAAIRFAEEPFFAGLRRLAIKQPQSEQQTLIATGRQLVELCLESFHSETETYNFESKNYGITKAVALWRLPKNKGLLIHSLSWCPMLIDYGSLEHHDTSALEKWTMDGDYLHKNIYDYEGIYTCQDSDEMMIVSWSPLAYSKIPLKKEARSLITKKMYAMKNRFNLYATLKNPIFDPLKLKLFPVPIRWHTHDIDKNWHHYEKRVKILLQKKPSLFIYFIYQYSSCLIYYTKKIIKYFFVALKACCGEKAAQEQLKHRISLFRN